MVALGQNGDGHIFDPAPAKPVAGQSPYLPYQEGPAWLQPRRFAAWSTEIADAPIAARSEYPTRPFLLAAGGWLLALSGTTFQMLRGLSDNAYTWLLILVVLSPVGTLFLIAAALPTKARRRVWYLALGLLWIIGALGLALLAVALVIIPFQGYPTVAPFLWYLLGFVLLAATLYLIGLRPLRSAPSP